MLKPLRDSVHLTWMQNQANEIDKVLDSAYFTLSDFQSAWSTLKIIGECLRCIFLPELLFTVLPHAASYTHIHTLIADATRCQTAHGEITGSASHSGTLRVNFPSLAVLSNSPPHFNQVKATTPFFTRRIFRWRNVWLPTFYTQQLLWENFILWSIKLAKDLFKWGKSKSEGTINAALRIDPAELSQSPEHGSI